MIEVLILIAVALIGILLVLGRISLTLKGILEALTEKRGTESLASISMAGVSNKAVQSAEPAPVEDRGTPDALQDIAAVVAVAERTRHQGSSEPRAS